MDIQFFMPTKVYFGIDCIARQSAEFAQWGNRALLVTGRNSAKASGALADVTAALEQSGIVWAIYDQIEENPSLEAVAAGGAAARRFGPDMLIAIGGGSPLDAAKAIAVLAVNDIAARQLYDGNFTVRPLPVLAVPITAGTGSEVTQYSVLTDNEQQTKRSFATPDNFPKVAFLDARYTRSLPWAVTVNSAVDALSHAIEGYLANRSTALSDALALQAMRAFGLVSASLARGELTLDEREKLLYASLLGGMVIAQTGTTAVHALGYPLTFFHQVPHGRANGLLLGEYLRFNTPAVPEKVSQVLAAVQLSDVDAFKALMHRLLPGDEVYTGRQIQEFARIAAQASNLANTPRCPGREDLEHLLQASLNIAGE